MTLTQMELDAVCSPSLDPKPWLTVGTSRLAALGFTVSVVRPMVSPGEQEGHQGNLEHGYQGNHILEPIVSRPGTGSVSPPA